MATSDSVRFFDDQFRRQLHDADLRLNPFEQAALPFLQGRVLDYGCGLGNLVLAAARQGCSVLALDASPAAIAHLREVAAVERLSLRAEEADLRAYVLREDFDTVVCIGLLMFFDCTTADAQLAALQARVRPGGVLALNVLVEGTTYLDMFDAAGHCVFARGELERRLAGWELLYAAHETFAAPHDTVKAFDTVIARKPA